MIISASRRTDIPKFFAGWFMRRVREGFYCSRNPFNPWDVKRTSLEPDDVDAIVFWSKDPAPMLGFLDELDSMSYAYYFQFTLNDYPSTVEPGVPTVMRRLDTFRRLAERIGPSRVLWRYDPVIVSRGFPPSYHVDRIERIARVLQGFTTRLTISFLDMYGKVRRRLMQSGTPLLADIVDLTCSENRDLLLGFARELAAIGGDCGLDVRTCAEHVDLTPAGIRPGACVDGELVNLIRTKGVHERKRFRRDRGQRTGCLCSESRDMGAYNTCAHGCLYCYANYGERSIRKNLSKHSADSPFLLD